MFLRGLTGKNGVLNFIERTTGYNERVEAKIGAIGGRKLYENFQLMYL